ncbi:ATP-binding cassette domain-containing protein [Dactylosporangium sp. NPDC051485]|uniref:ATP-binding cassette domain-containing protein n=1 Tax=Dactylosporangium sp. NPDC051485 TaxID=3154846 RepID=UPI00341DDAA7
MSMLELHGVTRRYGGLTALSDLTLTIPTGYRHALIGTNGAGKTTVVNLIAGTIRPSSGRIVLDGRTITHTGVTRRARHGIGRTWQHPAILRPLTVAENVALAVTPSTAPSILPAWTKLTTAARVRRHQLRDRVAAALDRVGLLADADRTAGELSYGQQRFLELGVVLAANPRLLLLDEPSAGLDPHDVDRLGDLITNLPADVTVLLIDHRLDLIWRTATTVTALDQGHHLATGTPAQIRANDEVQRAYLTGGTTPPPARVARTVRAADCSPLLRVDALRADYDGAPVLRGVDVHVDAGEVVAVLGRNGTGKSTLLSSIAGLHRSATADRMLLDGVVVPTDPYRAAALGVAVVPQTRRLFTGLTVQDHLRGAAAVARPAGTRQRWTTGDVFTLFPRLRERLHHRAGQLSGGEQQMLAVARALLINPRLLLLDEPTEGLAPAVIDALAATVGVIAARGVGILLAEQHLQFVAQLADRFVVLEHGYIAMTAPVAGLGDPAHRGRLDALLGVQPVGSPT